MKKLITILLAFVLSVLSIQAQKSIKGVIEINFNNIQAIKNGEKITGYYMFYKEDKLKRKNYAYRLIIFDENTEQVAEKSLVASEEFRLLESGYNQGLLCFKFYDIKESMFSLVFYDNEANMVSTKKYEAKKIEKKMMIYYLQSNVKSAPSLIAVDNSGFLNYRMVRNKSDGYIVTYYPNDSQKKSWVFKSSATSEEQEYITNLSSTGGIITNILAKKATRMSRDFTSSLSVLDINTGKEIYNKPLESSKYREMYLNSIYDKEKEELTLIGYYFPIDEKYTKAESLGLILTKFDKSGNEIEKKYVDWSADVAKILPLDKKGKFEDIGYIYFHRFVKNADGKIYGIGESFKKASGMASSNSSTLKVGDIYIFEFNSTFELNDVKVFDKGETRVNIPLGGSPIITGVIIKALNGFDISYIKELDDKNSFVIFYQDFEKRKKEKNKTVCGVISNTNGIYSEDKMDIDTDADYVKVLPAEGSNVLFLEYFKKEHDIQMNLKKMNY